MTETVKPKRRMTIVEIVVTSFFVGIVGIFVIAVHNEREFVREHLCFINQQQIIEVTIIYVQDHKNYFPAKKSYWQVININMIIESEVLICPTKGNKSLNSYAFNTGLDKKSLNNINDPSSVFVTCDSDAANNLWYSPADSAKRHRGKCVYSYVDGHVEENSKDYVIK